MMVPINQMADAIPHSSTAGPLNHLSEWFDGGFQGIGEKVVKTGMDAVTEISRIVPFDPEDLLDELLLEDNPAFGPFQDGNLVGVEAAAAPEDQLTAVNLVSLETVCHFHLL